jgi:parvulin-like peptidyl-prolyl isomerase
MSSKFEPLEEPKDRTKLIWLGVFLLLGIVVAALWVMSAQRGDVTQVRAKHILIKCKKDDPVDRARALKLITELRDRIKNGESFSRLAKDYSDDEMSSARGGDLGYYPKSTFDPAFEAYVWSAPVGELSDVVQSSYGFHLIIVVDRHVSKADQYEMELEKKAKENVGSTPGEGSASPKQP